MIDFGVSERKTEELQQRMAACGLIEADMDEQFVRSQGPGGQHVNKTATCVILKHRPTGLQVKVQQGRSQAMNRFYARRRLCELLEAKQLGDQSPAAQRIARLRKQKNRRKRRRNAKSASVRPPED